MDEINQRILSVVENSGMKRVDIGKKCGVSGQHISMLCSGASAPSNAFIMAFCRAMTIDEVWLRTGLGSPRPQSTLAEDVGRLVSEAMTDATVAEREEIAKALVRMGPSGWHHLLLFLEEYSKSLEANRPE